MFLKEVADSSTLPCSKLGPEVAILDWYTQVFISKCMNQKLLYQRQMQLVKPIELIEPLKLPPKGALFPNLDLASFRRHATLN